MTVVPRKRARALGLWIDSVTISEAVDRAEAIAHAGQGGVLVAANLNYAEWAASLPELGRQTARADLCVADGMALVVASRWPVLGGGEGRLPMRVTGSDLVEGIALRLAQTGGTLWLAGKHAVSNTIAAGYLARKYPGLNVSVRPLEGLSIAVRAEAPTFLFLALGQPQGDLWIEQHRGELGHTVVLQIGGALDYLSGLQKRAPEAWGNRGLEWAYRLLHQPRRLGPRYLGNALFLLKWIVANVGHRRRQRQHFAGGGTE